MAFNSFVMLSLLSLSLLVMRADALKCFRCNSFDNPECFTVNSGPNQGDLANTTATTTTMRNSTKPQQFLEECGLDEKGREPFCRKISLTVLNNKHHRVIRECGYERSKTDCYLADNEDHLETVCQCWTDGCNGSTGLELSIAAIVAAALLRLLV